MVMRQIRAFIQEEGERSTFFQEAFQQSQRIVLERQAAVRAVAESLVREQTLQVARVLAVFKAAGDNQRGSDSR